MLAAAQGVNIQPEGFNIAPTGVNIQPQARCQSYLPACASSHVCRSLLPVLQECLCTVQLRLPVR